QPIHWPPRSPTINIQYRCISSPSKSNSPSTKPLTWSSCRQRSGRPRSNEKVAKNINYFPTAVFDSSRCSCSTGNLAGINTVVLRREMHVKTRSGCVGNHSVCAHSVRTGRKNGGEILRRRHGNRRRGGRQDATVRLSDNAIRN